MRRLITVGERIFMQRKFLSISTALLILGLFLSACGGGSGGTEPTTSAATSTPPTLAPLEPIYSSDSIDEGKGLFAANCSACHGAAANGVEGLGKGLRSNEFVQGKTDDDLLEFIKAGRPVDDPLNTTGVVMPPYGGNPAMSDDQIQNIIAFLRSLQD